MVTKVVRVLIFLFILTGPNLLFAFPVKAQVGIASGACNFKAASYAPHIESSTGEVVTRRIRVDFDTLQKTDYELRVVARHRLEFKEIEDTVNVSGTESAARPNLIFYLIINPKEPEGLYDVSLYVRSDANRPCQGTAPKEVNVTHETDKFVPPDSAVGNIFNPVKFGSLGEIMTSLIPSLFAIAGMVAFGVLVYGGIRYALARGDAKAAESARGIITNAITGLGIILAVFVIYQIITTVLGFTVFALIPSANAQTVDIGNAVKIGPQSIRQAFPTVGSLVTTLVAAAAALMGVIFFALLLWGGIRYMLSRGDEKAIAEARTILTNAIIGLLIVLGAFAIITLIQFVTGQTALTIFG